MKSPKHRPDAIGDEQAEQLLRDYMQSAGLAIPVTLEEVAAAEALIDEDRVEIPPRLRDCAAVAQSICQGGVPRVLVFPSHTTYEAGDLLARAAREGGDISPDIEEKMRQDRLQAEREQSDGD